MNNHYFTDFSCFDSALLPGNNGKHTQEVRQHAAFRSKACMSGDTVFRLLRCRR